ncbi:hypothetical protein ABZ312_09520 [Streptomyces sp. NPDC006207]
MAGKCCGGGTMVVRSGSSAATVDPAPCNALTESASGLLVPSVALQGIAPGGAVSAERSVDVDVTAPAAGACPATWQVGARLTPVLGESFLPAIVDLVPVANDTWVNTGLTVVLPEAGVYEVTATVRSSIARGAVTTPFAVNISARLFNLTGGNAIPNTDYTVQQVNEASPSSGQTTQVALSTFHKFVTATGPTTIGIQANRNTINGAAVNVTAIQTGNTRLGFTKISD